MKRIILPVIVALFMVAAIVYYLFNKPHRDVASEKALYAFGDTQLNLLLSTKFDSAFKILGDQPVEVSGTISSIEGDSNQLIILEGVVVQMQEINADVTVGRVVSIKGRLTGFDDLFGEVKLDQGVIINSQK